MDRVKKRSATKMKVSRRQKNATGALCLALILAALPGRAAAAGHETSHSAPPSGAPTVGAKAIDFDLTTLDSRSIRLDTFRGKPLVINLFATWCDPCREEMPIINGLASESKNQSYSVLGIAVRDDRAAVTEYAREAGLVFPIALDLNSKTQRAYRIFGPPATFFVDAQGVLRDFVLGPITAERAREGLRKSAALR